MESVSVNSPLKKLFLITAAALVLPLAAHAQNYKAGDAYPGGGIVMQADDSQVLVRFVKSVFPLSRETRFEKGRKYPSPSGNHYLVFQGDGNLVVYTKQDRPVWALNSLTPNWRTNGYAVFQSDGNLATYQANNAFVWSARNVVSPAGTTLTLNDRGELQLIAPNGQALWTGTAN